MPLPLSKAQAIKAVTWLKTNYRNSFKTAVANTPFTIDLLCAIICQETAFAWLPWINTKTPKEILSLCVFDASGDFPGTNRSAFPKNTAAFRTKMGDALTNMLIAEANKSRAVRGFQPKDWIYKGYGIFQYDLQHIDPDLEFFEMKRWYRMSKCLEKVMMELNRKWAIHNNLFKTIKSYNGSGPAAEEYANNVIIFMSYSAEVS